MSGLKVVESEKANKDLKSIYLSLSSMNKLRQAEVDCTRHSEQV